MNEVREDDRAFEQWLERGAWGRALINLLMTVSVVSAGLYGAWPLVIAHHLGNWRYGVKFAAVILLSYLVIPSAYMLQIIFGAPRLSTTAFVSAWAVTCAGWICSHLLMFVTFNRILSRHFANAALLAASSPVAGPFEGNTVLIAALAAYRVSPRARGVELASLAIASAKLPDDLQKLRALADALYKSKKWQDAADAYERVIPWSSRDASNSMQHRIRYAKRRLAAAPLARINPRVACFAGHLIRAAGFLLLFVVGSVAWRRLDDLSERTTWEDALSGAGGWLLATAIGVAVCGVAVVLGSILIAAGTKTLAIDDNARPVLAQNAKEERV